MKDVAEVACLVEKREHDEIEEYREPLSIHEKRELTILLSWGGPSDGYKILFDKDNEAVDGSYFFADWFEYKEFKLTGEELDSVLTVYPVSPDVSCVVACLPTVRHSRGDGRKQASWNCLSPDTIRKALYGLTRALGTVSRFR